MPAWIIVSSEVIPQNINGFWIPQRDREGSLPGGSKLHTELIYKVCKLSHTPFGLENIIYLVYCMPIMWCLYAESIPA